MKGVSGIYEIRNVVSGKRYIGSAVDFDKRWKTHRRQLNAGKHFSKNMQASWNKYGGEQFAFRPLLICAREHLLMYEQIAIDGLLPEFNSCKVAGSTLGIKYSPETLARLSIVHSTANLSAETRARMSASQADRRHTDETKKKLSLLWRGRKLSAEECARRSERMKGHFVSEETRAKMAAAATGKPVSAETRRKLSVASTGRRHTPEARAKIAAAKLGNSVCVGRRHSDETRAKIYAAHKGRVFTPEHRANISASAKRRKRGKRVAGRD